MCKTKAFLSHKSFASDDHLGRQCKQGAPPSLHRILRIELSSEAVRIPCIGCELALRRAVHPHGATQDKVSQRPCVPRQQRSRGCTRPSMERGSGWWLRPPGAWAAPCEHQYCAAQMRALVILHATKTTSYWVLNVAFNSFHLRIF